MSILNWIEDKKRLKVLNAPKYVATSADSSKGLWTRCDKCGIILYIKHLKENQRVCFGCSYHLQMMSGERIENLLDKLPTTSLSLGGSYKSTPEGGSGYGVQSKTLQKICNTRPFGPRKKSNSGVSKEGVAGVTGQSFAYPNNSSTVSKTRVSTWRPLDETVSPCDPLRFHDQKRYRDRLQDAQERTGLQDAIQTGTGMIDGIPVALAVMDFSFMGGSMGSVVGEKITRLIEYATGEGLTLLIVSASGGARMQEGVFSLMQMAKISSALQVYQSCAKLLYISILTSPTTGGVTASFAMLGDIIFAEPKALIAFAGRRVIEQTLSEDLPDDFQTSEYMLHHGLVDLIVPRRFLRQAVSESIRLYQNAPFKKRGQIPFGVQNPINFLTEEKIRRSWGVLTNFGSEREVSSDRLSFCSASPSLPEEAVGSKQSLEQANKQSKASPLNTHGVSTPSFERRFVHAAEDVVGSQSFARRGTSPKVMRYKSPICKTQPSILHTQSSTPFGAYREILTSFEIMLHLFVSGNMKKEDSEETRLRKEWVAMPQRNVEPCKAQMGNESLRHLGDGLETDKNGDWLRHPVSFWLYNGMILRKCNFCNAIPFRKKAFTNRKFVGGSWFEALLRTGHGARDKKRLEQAHLYQYSFSTKLRIQVQSKALLPQKRLPNSAAKSFVRNTALRPLRHLWWKREPSDEMGTPRSFGKVAHGTQDGVTRFSDHGTNGSKAADCKLSFDLENRAKTNTRSSKKFLALTEKSVYQRLAGDLYLSFLLGSLEDRFFLWKTRNGTSSIPYKEEPSLPTSQTAILYTEKKDTKKDQTGRICKEKSPFSKHFYQKRNKALKNKKSLQEGYNFSYKALFYLCAKNADSILSVFKNENRSLLYKRAFTFMKFSYGVKQIENSFKVRQKLGGAPTSFFETLHKRSSGGSSTFVSPYSPSPASHTGMNTGGEATEKTLFNKGGKEIRTSSPLVKSSKTNRTCRATQSFVSPPSKPVVVTSKRSFLQTDGWLRHQEIDRASLLHDFRVSSENTQFARNLVASAKESTAPHKSTTSQILAAKPPAPSGEDLCGAVGSKQSFEQAVQSKASSPRPCPPPKVAASLRFGKVLQSRALHGTQKICTSHQANWSNRSAIGLKHTDYLCERALFFLQDKDRSYLFARTGSGDGSTPFTSSFVKTTKRLTRYGENGFAKKVSGVLAGSVGQSFVTPKTLSIVDRKGEFCPKGQVVMQQSKQNKKFTTKKADINFLNQAIELAATEGVEWRAFYIYQQLSENTGFLEDFLKQEPNSRKQNSNVFFYKSICRSEKALGGIKSR